MAKAQPNFGSSWSCITDLVTPSTMATGFRIVAEACLRRWITPRGLLIDDPNYGFDLTDYLGSDFDVSSLARVASGAAAEAEKDERVESAKVSIVLTGDTMVVTAQIETSQGPFTFVASVSAITTTLLQVLAA